MLSAIEAEEEMTVAEYYNKIDMYYLDDEEKSLSLPSPSDTSTGFSPDSPLCSLTADYLSDEGAFGQKRFTGATLGLFAVGHGKAVFSELQFRFLSDLA